MQLAIEAAVKSNLAYVKDNWDRLRIATGLDLAFDKDRLEDFVNYSPMLIALTIHTPT